MKALFLSLFLVASTFAFTLRAQEPAVAGIQDQAAPPLNASEWIQLPEGKDKAEVADYEGKVLVMLFFQYTTPFVHEESLPLLKKLVDRYAGNDKIGFLAVQVVGENLKENAPNKLPLVAEKYGLDIPLGHYVPLPEFPGIVGAYKPGASPWWVIVDREGNVEWNGSFLDETAAFENLDKMLAGQPVD